MTGNIETRIKELQAVVFLLKQSPQFKRSDSLIQRTIANINRAVGDLETLVERDQEEAVSSNEPCEHEWHRFGTVNGSPDAGCQKCGATRS